MELIFKLALLLRVEQVQDQVKAQAAAEQELQVMVFQDNLYLLFLAEQVVLAAEQQEADQQAELEEQVYFTCIIKL
jgi:hypothetical protein